MKETKKMNLKEVKEMYLKDTLADKNRHICNDAIINLINLINDDSKTIQCEIAKGGSVLNRGSVVECLIKLLFKGYNSTSKYKQLRNDINIDGVGYEIKYTNSVAYASFTQLQRNEYNNKHYKPLILVDQFGVYLSNTEYYNIAKNGKIKGVKKVLKRVIEW